MVAFLLTLHYSLYYLPKTFLSSYLSSTILGNSRRKMYYYIIAKAVIKYCSSVLLGSMYGWHNTLVANLFSIVENSKLSSRQES
ncbi:hypothetical protein BGX38DRAFT_351895 [Terfezia claveryi]|nr:hypothetical protein BGX38DRAFT_351895 [Terfezia claveryi]